MFPKHLGNNRSTKLGNRTTERIRRSHKGYGFSNFYLPNL